MSKSNNKTLRDSGYGAVQDNNKLYANPAKALGIVITPNNLTYLMSRLIQLKPSDTLLDPCAGTGAFLMMAHRLGVKHLYGIEKDKHIYKALEQNLKGTKAQIVNGDCFKSHFNHKKFDKILLNPPYQLPCIEFVYHALHLLKNNGQLAVIVPESVFVSGGKSKRKIMKKCKEYILKNCQVKGIVTVNPNAFYPVGTQTCILVFKKCVGKGNGKYQKANLYNFTHDGYKLINKHGLQAQKGTEAKYNKLIKDINNGEANGKNALTAKLTKDNEWLYNAFWYNPTPPTDKDFRKTIADYVSFKVNMQLHGRGYLFKEGKKNE